MLLKTSAIVLHALKYSDNNVIVHTYTEEHGRMAYVVRGAQSKRSAVRTAMLQPLSILNLETYHNPNRELQQVRESHIGYAFESLPFDPAKNALAMFIAELLYRSLRVPHTDPDLYRFIHRSVCVLDGIQKGIGNFHLAFLLQFARHMGFAPTNDGYFEKSFFDLKNGIFVAEKPSADNCLNSYDSALFAASCRLSYDNMGEFRLSRDDRKMLLSHWLAYYRLHLPQFSELKSLEVSYQLFD
ncbi:MAG: DNA repair protein RecO [Prevotellaceae bacterium]|jgi:DNA repair protein RecO (recombination protein O)|nr:DNA repair protein RecO [Prevotellaceae bacterium]